MPTLSTNTATPVVFNSGESLSTDKIQRMIDKDQYLYNLLQNTAWGDEISYQLYAPGFATSSILSSGAQSIYFAPNRMYLFSLHAGADTDQSYNYTTSFAFQIKIDSSYYMEFNTGTLTGTTTWPDNYENGFDFQKIVPNLTEGIHVVDVICASAAFHSGDLVYGGLRIEDVGAYVASQ